MSNLSVNQITDASGGSTASINGLTPQASNMQPFNRIINGAMTIDQRNAGAAVTYSSGFAYLLDRWYGQGVTSAGVFTLQQSTDVPAGFNNSLKATVTTASTPSGTQVYRLIQRIEGFNTADLNLGTANAKTLTMSFWVKSSVTGTFGGSFWGGNATAWFPFSYTINSANTWEYKTVSIAAASSTPATAFNTTTGVGLQLTFNFGAASATLATPSSWIYGATEYYGPTGQTNLIETNGATFYITGVQLEAGSTASSFAHENYADTLRKCQRYYYSWSSSGLSDIYAFRSPYVSSPPNSSASVGYFFPVTMRSNPSMVGTGLSLNRFTANQHGAIAQLSSTSGASAYSLSDFTASAEL
jgi:hypothetical protein